MKLDVVSLEEGVELDNSSGSDVHLEDVHVQAPRASGMASQASKPYASKPNHKYFTDESVNRSIPTGKVETA